MHKTLVSVATAGLMLAGVLTASPVSAATAAAPDPSATYQPPPVQFGPCTSPSLILAGAECGYVVVPLDYYAPDGQKIRLAISRVRAKAPADQYQGVMLVNPGGPGKPGLGLSRLQSRIPNGAGNTYDWIGFDPRGVGESRPTVSCNSNYAGYNKPYYVPDKPADELKWITKAGLYTAGCGLRNYALLKNLKTTDLARDMDSIRKVLDQPKINYYGFGYGSYLGSVYATLFPERVNRMVFDGVVDPAKVWEQNAYDQDIATERGIKIFFDWVARYDSVYHLGTTGAAVERRYYEQYAKLRSAPAGGLIGSSEWNDVISKAAVDVFGWEDIASAFSTWVNNGDPSGLIALYPVPGGDNEYAAYLGTTCSDAKWSAYLQHRKRNVELYPRAPFLTWGNAWRNAPCTAWPVPAGTPTVVDGSAAPPILLIAETLDSVTPYSGALATRRLFPNSRLVEGVGGTTHAGTLQGSQCENSIVAAYLRDGRLPARANGDRSDAQCEPNPQPVPSALSSTSAGS